MKVRSTLIFLLSVIAVLALVAVFFPKDGIRITENFTLYFPSIDEFLPSKDSKADEMLVDVDSVINNQIDIDEIIPSQPQYEQKTGKLLTDNSSNLNAEYNIEAIKSKITQIEFPEGDVTVLDKFFEKLSHHDEYEKIRVLHYGDSQIEGDRITAYIRYKLQGRFGGYGVGMCSPVAIYAQYSLKQENSDNWLRFSGFQKSQADLIADKKFGPMMAFNRFSPRRDSSYVRPAEPYKAWLKFYKSTMGYENTRKFKDVYIYYGNAVENTKIVIKVNDAVVHEGVLPASENLNVYQYKMAEYVDNATIEFESFDSPDFYAISLEDEKGIYIDNIAMRGSSGTVFSTTNRALLAESYKKLGVDLFILQFGGNSVPYTKNLDGVRNFTNYFAAQIKVIRSMCPNASILVVGPSDMSVKIKDTYETYPILDTMINELKATALKNKCAYWDIYKAMGGKNSMPKWVEADPPLAATDYTHFSPQGAHIISNMLYNSLIVEYSNYLERKEGKR